MELYPDQEEAHDIIMASVKTSLEPIMSELGTGYGKSLLSAALANTVIKTSGKRVINLVPTEELVSQNAKVYNLLGYGTASQYCASLNLKQTGGAYTVGSYKSVRNGIVRLADNVAMIILDECHNLCDTVLETILYIKKHNPNVRIVGLTATGYRLDCGFIYRENHLGEKVEYVGSPPFFAKCVYVKGYPELVKVGRLSPVKWVVAENSYDTSLLENIDDKKEMTSKQVSETVDDTAKEARLAEVKRSINANTKTIIYLANKEQVKEYRTHFPYAGYVDAKTKSKERVKTVADFKSGKIKLLLNMRCFTTGFDVPDLDNVIILYVSNSTSTFIQTVGRGARLSEGKDVFNVLDFGGNIGRLTYGDDLLTPRVIRNTTPTMSASVSCPSCFDRRLRRVDIDKSQWSLYKDVSYETGQYSDVTGVRSFVADKECKKCKHIFNPTKCVDNLHLLTVNVVKNKSVERIYQKEF